MKALPKTCPSTKVLQPAQQMGKLFLAATKQKEERRLKTLKSSPLQSLKSFCAILIALLLIGAFSFLAGHHSVQPAGPALPLAADELGFTINRSPTMQTPQSLLNVKFENSAESSYAVRLELYSSDHSLLYASGTLAAGESLDNLELLEDLPVGQHTLTARVVATGPGNNDFGYVEQALNLKVG